MFAALAFALAVLAAAPADASDQAQAAAPTAAAAPVAPTKVQDADANKPVCHTEQTTGTRLGGMRVCMTKAQWEERASASGAALSDVQGRAAQFHVGH